MEEIQRVTPVIHEVDALARNVDQTKQGACTGWVSRVVEQGLENLDALRIGFHQKPVVAIHR
jgi:hypothetical protein